MQIEPTEEENKLEKMTEETVKTLDRNFDEYFEILKVDCEAPLPDLSVLQIRHCIFDFSKGGESKIKFI